MRVCVPRRVRLFATPWTVSRKAPLSMGFPRQEYWSGLPLPTPRDLPDPGIEPTSPAIPAFLEDSLPLSPQGSPAKDIMISERNQTKETPYGVITFV